MQAYKTSFQRNELQQWIEWQANGSAPGLKWTDANNVEWRAVASYQFDSTSEVYTILVSKYIRVPGTENWILDKEYPIVADYTKFRKFSTGELIPDITGIPAALDGLGNVVDPNGWVYNSKYFTILIGYNLFNIPVSINYWVYLEIAEYEGLTI
jgi:hypothetical protein